MSAPAATTPLAAVTRACGATMAVRDGHCVAAHYGSAASELAVCCRTVGLTDRCTRSTLDVHGEPGALHEAVDRLGALGDAVWWAELSPSGALVRCEPGVVDCCVDALRDDDLAVEDHTGRYAALGLVGPLAVDAVRMARLDEVAYPVTIVPEPAGIELLVPARQGSDAWARLLESGTALGIACIGAEAIERLALSRHLDAAQRTATR